MTEGFILKNWLTQLVGVGGAGGRALSLKFAEQAGLKAGSCNRS